MRVVIGLTIIAVGTSPPELVTSMVATWKGQNDIANGNVIGPDIFIIASKIVFSAVLC